MTSLQERLPNDYASLVRRIEALERDLQAARAARRLEASTIGRGGITVQGGAVVLRDDAGHEIARMGAREDLPHAPDGSVQPGFILRRNDGTIAFTLDDPDPNNNGYRQLLKMHDQQGHVIFQEDYNAGWGYSNPTFSFSMSPLTPDKWPGTAETTWTNMLFSQIQIWNPLLDVGMVGTTSVSGTTGQLRVVVDGTQVGDILNVDFSYSQSNVTVDFTSMPGYEPGDSAQVLIQAQRTAGTGSVQASYNWVTGRGSAAII